MPPGSSTVAAANSRAGDAGIRSSLFQKPVFGVYRKHTAL
jgi:hypothetical protein